MKQPLKRLFFALAISALLISGYSIQSPLSTPAAHASGGD